MARRRAVRSFTLAFAGAIAVVGCELLAGLSAPTLVDDGGVPPSDGHSEVGDGACEPSFVQDLAQPDGAVFDGHALAAAEFAVALQAFDIFAMSNADLDGTNTSGVESSSCTPPSPADRGYIDLDGGADNLSAYYFDGVRSLPDQPLRPDRIHGQVDRGELAIAIRVAKYNGQADDDEVAVSFIPLRGLAPNVFDAGGALRTGKRDDPWVRDAEFAVEGLDRLTDVFANVVRGVVQARFPAITFKLMYLGASSPPLGIQLQDVLLRARIVTDTNGDFRLTQGELAGRWVVPDMLRAFGSLINGDGGALCNDAQFGVLKTACKLADLAASPGDDVCSAASRRTLKPCTAMSTYHTFDTYPIDYPVQLAPFPSVSGLSLCDPALVRCE